MAAFARKLFGVFEEELFPAPSSEILFNPYRDEDPDYDLTGAAEIRRENLRNYFFSFRKAPPVLMVGEAPGPRGCRFSGIPFTSERQLLAGMFPFAGKKSGKAARPYSEPSGTILWEALLPFYPGFLLWNAVPLHPHKPGRPISVRAPGRAEISAFAGLLAKVVSFTAPDRVVALGRNAEHALGLAGVRAEYVRHPSQAGAPEFRRGVLKVVRGAGLA